MCLHVSFRIQDKRDGSEKRAKAEYLRDFQRLYDGVCFVLYHIYVLTLVCSILKHPLILDSSIIAMLIGSQSLRN